MIRPARGPVSALCRQLLQCATRGATVTLSGVVTCRARAARSGLLAVRVSGHSARNEGRAPCSATLAPYSRSSPLLRRRPAASKEAQTLSPGASPFHTPHGDERVRASTTPRPRPLEREPRTSPPSRVRRLSAPSDRQLTLAFRYVSRPLAAEVVAHNRSRQPGRSVPRARRPADVNHRRPQRRLAHIRVARKRAFVTGRLRTSPRTARPRTPRHAAPTPARRPYSFAPVPPCLLPKRASLKSVLAPDEKARVRPSAPPPSWSRNNSWAGVIFRRLRESTRRGLRQCFHSPLSSSMSGRAGEQGLAVSHRQAMRARVDGTTSPVRPYAGSAH